MMTLRIPFYQDIGWLLIRINLGLVFLVHGWAKWKNFAGTVEFFSSLGIATWLVYVVAAWELVGGLAVMCGWLTRFFSLGLAVIMAVAIMMVKFESGFVGGYEFELVLLLMSLALVLAGPGRYRLRLTNWGNHQEL